LRFRQREDGDPICNRPDEGQGRGRPTEAPNSGLPKQTQKKRKDNPMDDPNVTLGTDPSPSPLDREPSFVLWSAIIWLLRAGASVLVDELISRLTPRVSEKQRLAAFGRWATSNPGQVGEFAAPERQAEQGLRAMIDEVILRLGATGLCEDSGEGPTRKVCLEIGRDGALDQQIIDMNEAAQKGTLAGLEVHEYGRPYTTAELEGRIATAIGGPWDRLTRCLMVEHTLQTLLCDSSWERVEPPAVDDREMETGQTETESEQVEPPMATGAAAGAAVAERQSVPQAAPAIQVDLEFANLIPRPTEEERAQLKANLLAAGVCRDPLSIWKGHNTLLDGHQRLALCQTHKIPFETVEIELPGHEAAKEWIIRHQLGRRNLPPEAGSYLRGMLYNARKHPHGGDRTGDQSSAQSDHLRTAEVLAQEQGVSPATIRRDGVFAQAVDTVAAACGPQVKQAILSGQTNLTRTQVGELAKQEPEVQQQAAQDALQGGKKMRTDKKARGDKTTNKGANETLCLPAEPGALAEAILTQLGRKRASQVHRALGDLLEGSGQKPPKGRRQTRSSGGPKSDS
jgi:hypothetical protein